jgi:hypothetical protein
LLAGKPGAPLEDVAFYRYLRRRNYLSLRELQTDEHQENTLQRLWGDFSTTTIDNENAYAVYDEKIVTLKCEMNKPI